MSRTKLQEWGYAMMDISLGTLVTYGAAMTGIGATVIAILNIIQGTYQGNTFGQWLLLLLEFALTATIVTLILGFMFKSITYGLGRLLILFGEPYPMPQISVPVKDSEIKRLFKIIDGKLYQRSRALKGAGLVVKKEVRRRGYFYRISYLDRLVYHFSMSPRTEGGAKNKVEFYHGWTEPLPNAVTAFGTIFAVLGQKPFVRLSNLSLLNPPGLKKDFSYEELGEEIWKEVIKIIESRMQQ